ncbi:YerC/YecD family TrpR-related protein [Pseudomonadota bacterium]
MVEKKSSKNYCPLNEAILKLKTSDEVRRFLRDLCTPSEIKAFEERWTVAQLLYDGSFSYCKINEMTGTSTTTITRVARFLNKEEYQGYKLVLDRLKKRGKNDRKK